MRQTAFLATMFICMLASPAFAKDPPASEPSAGCGTFQYEREHVGPLDFRTLDPYLRKLIEDFHFTRQVEALRHGQSSTIGGDLRYTLNAIPNHPRALRAMAEYFRREGVGAIDATRETGHSLACWFDRALSYRPDDPMVRILYADELLKEGKREEARAQLEVAEKNAGDSSTVHYNLGLLYLDLKDMDRAVAHAHKAYELGAPVPGLKNKLAQAGKWRD